MEHGLGEKSSKKKYVEKVQLSPAGIFQHAAAENAKRRGLWAGS